MRLIYSALPLALQALVAIVLSRLLGPIAGAAAFAALAVATVLVAGGLIRRAPVGVVTWRNRVAGLLLPWSMVLGGGTMKSLLIKNMVAGGLFGIFVITIDALFLNPVSTAVPAAPPSPGWASAIVFGVTIACWIVMLVAWLWVLRAQLGRHSEPISMLMVRPGVRFALLAPPVAIAASIALRYFGYHLVAMLIVGLPLLVVLGPVLAMVLVLLSYTVRGKPIRWN